MKSATRHILISMSFCLFLWCLPAQAQLRVVSWNTAGGPRTGLGDILEAIGNESVNGIVKPIDVLSLQEQSSSTNTTQLIVDLLNGIYGSGTYERATIDGGTSGAGSPGLIYNTTTVTLESEVAFGTVSTSAQARQTLRYQLQPIGYDILSNFYVYSNHYKASTGSSNKARRLVEAEAVRADADALGEFAKIIYTGDFNIRSSSEDSYVKLLSAGNGQAFDPIDTPGSWHDSSTFKLVHTQAPAVDPPGSLVGSGIDDRFDFQLVSGELLDNEGLSYIPGSYHVFGNNGTHTLDGDISSGTGASPAILSTLEAVSDHLPVVADYQVPALLDFTVDAIPSQVQLGSLVEFKVMVENIANVVSPLGADELDYVLSGVNGVNGFFSDSDLALDIGNTHTFTLDTSSIGTRNASLEIINNSPDNLVGGVVVPINFEVVTTMNNADFDQDNDVDGADFLTWQRGFGIGTLFSEGDANGSGTVDAADLAIWESQIGTLPLSSIEAIPEPSSGILIAWGLVGLWHCRR